MARDNYTEIHDYTWSPDGRWLAYSITANNQQAGIWLYNTETRKATLVSNSRDNDFQPVFDPTGKYLFFLSTRHENPTFSRTEFNIATLKMTGIYVATLKRGAVSPLAPQSDEGVGEGKKDDQDNKDNKDKKAEHTPDEHKPEVKALQVDLEGLLGRSVALPIPAAEIASFEVRDDKVFYLTGPSQLVEGQLPGEKTVLHVFDLKERKDADIVDDLSSYALSADGKRLLYKAQKDYFIVDATPEKGRSPEATKKLDLSHLRVRVEPTQEWLEMFNSAWRLERDFFYSPKMNGVDWQAVRAAYGKLLPLAGARSDLNFLIGEVLGELGNSHTYVGGGDEPAAESRVPTAYLGADFALDAATGRYKFATVFAGDNTRDTYRSPLTAPGVDVHAGEYLLAVDGQELRSPTDPYSLLVGRQDATLRLTVADGANGKRRDVVVEPVKNELPLREQAWVDHNREVVDRASGGKVAYIYLSDMGGRGMDQFIRQFYSQLDKQALIFDDRWNGGGFIDPIVLERLRRILIGMDTNRENSSIPIPGQLIIGPKICLMNHYSASDGDIFPFYFRKYGLGPLMGTRTWGGVRGIRGDWMLLDGGYITVPEDALYGLDSQWVIENHGVDPDIPVDDSPADWLQGRDVQLQAAVDYILAEMKKHPANLPAPPPALPAYPPAH